MTPPPNPWSWIQSPGPLGQIHGYTIPIWVTGMGTNRYKAEPRGCHMLKTEQMLTQRKYWTRELRQRLNYVLGSTEWRSEMGLELLSNLRWGRAAHHTVLRLRPYNLRVYMAYSGALTVRYSNMAIFTDKLMSHDQPWARTLATMTKAAYN